ncbi:MAG: hypothetical protein JJU36_08225 [Phycisphaeraceae bacterium]|nr:hypothetical protein [Phycisphaeraceae bacterium]
MLPMTWGGAAGLASAGDGGAAGAETSKPKSIERADAIATLRTQIETELERAGGSWESWAASLETFRDQLSVATSGRWPWTTHRDFRFQGAAVQLLRRDRVRGGNESVDPAEAIVHLDRQLRARGIDLIVMFVPDKVAVYPDYLVREPMPEMPVTIQMRRLMHELTTRDVEVIDLYTLYARFRAADPDTDLYYDRDSHWLNTGARLAADQIAQRLARYDFAQEARGPARYRLEPHERTDGAKADHILRVLQVDSDRQYSDVPRSPVIITGDSFSMYNMHLGGHLSAHVAHRLNMPVSFICREGLGPDLPVELARRHREGRFLEGRRVVVWTFVGRHLERGRWVKLDLPDRPALAQVDLHRLPATGRIASMAAPPDDPRTAVYTDYVRTVHLKDLKDDAGNVLGDGQAVVRVLAMRDRRHLPPATWRADQEVKLRLSSWNRFEGRFGTVETGSLPDEQVELTLPLFWGERIELNDQDAAEDESTEQRDR